MLLKGLLLVDKPIGWTSFDAVNYVRKIVAEVESKKPKNVKVGHSGTLDPFASGLLVLFIGKEFTKKASDYSKLDKVYSLSAKLGFVSSTGDPEGEVTIQSSKQPSLSQIEEAINKFKGQIDQIPPIYSAIKVNGQRAYSLARKGNNFSLPPRKVTINSLNIVNYAYPDLELTASVSSGTYIRSLVSDIGETLGTGAYTYTLRRSSVGKFNIEQACEPKLIRAESIHKLLLDA